MVVTGAASGLGRALAAHLAETLGPAAVVGADLVPHGLAGVAQAAVDVRDPQALAGAVAGARAVVHLAVSTDPDADPAARSDLNLRGSAAVIRAAAGAGVAHLVLVTSAAVHGARPDNPVPLDDAAPLRAEPEGLMADLLAIEAAAVAARRDHPGLRVTVVRPAAVVGAGVDSLVTRHFASPRMLVVKGTPMRWQFAHAADVVSAIALVLGGGVDADAVGVGGDGWLSTTEVARASGLPTVEVPATVAFATARRLHQAGLIPSPAGELAYVVYPWVVAADGLRRAGWAPAHDNAEVLAALLADVEGSTAVAGRVIRGRDATLAGAGVAGATVAVLGAAAFVRRARRLRGL